MLGAGNMNHLTSAGWRRRVQKKNGAVPNDVWDKIVDDGHIEIANDEEGIEEGAGLDYLIEVVKRELDSFNRYASQHPRLPKQQKSPETSPRELPPDGRFQALSEIVAAVISDEEDIKSFRQEVLNGQLLKPQEVPEWINSTKKKEGHTLTVSLNVAAGDSWGKDLVEQAEQIVLDAKKGKFTPGSTYGNVTLSYVDPGSEWQKVVSINTSGILGRLKMLAKKYEAFWREAWAVHFILTGEACAISRARVTTKFNSYGIDKIGLEVSPYMSGDKVKKIFLEEKKKVLNLTGKNRTRQLTKKHLMLAVFAVKVKKSWQWKLRLWNKKYPRWAYPDTARSWFARDCRAAYERLTGWKYTN